MAPAPPRSSTAPPLLRSTHRGPNADLLAAVSPVRVTVGGVPAWVVTSHDQVKRVLSSSDVSREGAYAPAAPTFPTLFTPPPGMIVSLDGHRHSRLRDLAEAAMGPTREPAFAATVTNLARHLAAKVRINLDTQAPCDLIKEFCEPLAAQVICHLLGIPTADIPRFQKWINAIADVTTTAEESAQAWAAMAHYVATAVGQRTANPGSDALSSLASRRHTYGVSEEDVVGLGFALIGGGYDSTQALLGLCLLQLLTDNPDEWALTAKDGVPAETFEELLRLTNLTSNDTTGLPRIATRDMVLGSSTICEGEAVFVSLACANRDPLVFGRSFGGDGAHLTFGHGPHRCLGESVARVTVGCGINALTAAAPHLGLEQVLAVPVWRSATVNHCLESLPVCEYPSGL